MSDLSPPHDPHWVARVNAVGRAQSRYLWLLLIVMLFFPAVRAAVYSSTSPATLRVPVVDLELDAAFVLAAGPIVISIVVLILFGTIRALRAAVNRLDKTLLISGELERFDEHPTGLDLVIYTTQTTKSSIAGILFLVFPLLLLGAVAEAAWLWLNLPFDLANRTGWRALLWAAPIVWTPALLHGIRFLADRGSKLKKGEHKKPSPTTQGAT